MSMRKLTSLLLCLFAGMGYIPVSTAPITTIANVEEAKSAGRTTVKATYDQILADLEFAEANLPSVSSDLAANASAAGTTKSWRANTNLISRASKAAAIALKARVHQHMGQWNNVVAESEKLVSASAPYTSPIGGRRLTAEPEGPFANNSNNTESIFSIENSSTDNCTINGSLSQLYHTARSLVGISHVIINADFWLADDKRRSQLTRVAVYSEMDINWSWKYRTGTVMSDWTPILRYAEVLLNYAEAEARVNGVTDKAVSLLNAVRNRAVTDVAKQFTTATFTSVDDLMTAIMNERRIELLAEGRRWPDIHRLKYDAKYSVKAADGKAGVPNKASYGSMTSTSYQPASGVVDPAIMKTAGFNFEDRRYVFPIPQSETSSNSVMAGQQNPGW